MSGTNSTNDNLPSSGFLIAMSIFASLCIIVGVIGNIGVITYNIFMNYSKTPTTCFVVNLAIADIIVCFTLFPSGLFEFISILMDKDSDRSLICKVIVTSSSTSLALSIAVILAITVDKCIFISKPLKYPMIMTWTKTYILIAAIFAVALINASLIFAYTDNTGNTRLSCAIGNSTVENIFYIPNIFLPSLGLCYFNYRIYKVAKNQRRKIRIASCSSQTHGNQNAEAEETAKKPQEERREMLRQIRVVKTFAIIIGVYFVCLFPKIITSRLRSRGVPISRSVSVATGMLVGLNSVVNPFVYGIRNKEYRIAYRQFFSRFLRG
ncbi:alpha-1A adrenergic receptor-like [Dendronephthya gigantea]|uniref:alpha-1A adrenergic receptor-like n=1 Tax=Dendronephthya gigantea TaxID=151771 RepID=UPI00106CAC48|nr:alpha-1A adrenergic receptor-like [Dendronephthya gigantea]